ncbi:S9 family peptidase [Shewanella yunxiaonensis]|uniref:S9 family peptidase n=2 Tax=Shewanella yunxiaonensis TaxID=2829809 RepID=A0ABX7YR00_9GAMM|nr:S9 family peptidase [Shewanella yunxiaonensis]QUN04726.1 S9 family peptidase [Shewanella yunxiaonensis]
MMTFGSAVRILSMAALLALQISCSPQPAVEVNTSAPEEQHTMKTAAYGTWESPLTADDVFGQSVVLGQMQSVDGAIYFSESDPAQAGQIGIKRLDDNDKVVDVVPAAFGVGSRVHEYGGAPYLAIGNSVFASKMSDQLFYRIAPDQPPLALTPAGTRHADCISYPKGSRIICVREDHRGEGEAKASLVTINLNFAGEGDTFVEGHDFFSSPAINADNTQLAWVAWDHPNMPWDNTQLWVGDLNRKGQISNIRQIAPRHHGSLMQPMYAPDGQLYFIADYDNWWNLYRVTAAGGIEQVTQLKGEIGGPAWRFGQHAYAFENAHSVIFSYHQDGKVHLMRQDLTSGVSEELATDFASVGQVISADKGVYFMGAKSTPEHGIYKVSGRGTELVYAPAIKGLEPDYISRPVAVSFDTNERQQAYGYFYAPTNPQYVAPKDTKPPLLMMLHGGPTAAASSAYSSAIQYWTTRGFAVFDLNYRGSTGYGRQYRKSLYGKWGVADVDDAVNAVKYLVDEGWVDPDKVAIRGGSAGGFSVLAALAFHDTFKAGTSYFGISDIAVLAQETHKFESHYIDQLIGPYPAAKQIFHDRSPLYHLEGLNEPLLLLQGLDDKVVPPNQSELIYQAVKAKGVPTAFIGFEGEGHGFRKPANNIRSLQSELSFYGQVFGFTPAGELPVLPIDNAAALPKAAQH